MMSRRRLVAVALIGLSAWSAPAHAEESIIKNPEDHTRYGFEVEPHVLLGYGGHGIGDGAPGAGIRGTFLLMDPGFIRTINDNIGLGLGIDAYPSHSTVIDVPFVLSWNFFLSTHFSVFGEPGLGIRLGGDATLHPTIFAGGRFHFSERIALTVRLGYPAVSVGVSFFL